MNLGKIVLSILSFALVLTSCKDSKPDNKAPLISPTVSDEDQVLDECPKSEMAANLVDPDPAAAGSYYEHCGQILSQGIANIKEENRTLKEEQYLLDHACNNFESLKSIVEADWVSYCATEDKKDWASKTQSGGGAAAGITIVGAFGGGGKASSSSSTTSFENSKICGSSSDRSNYLDTWKTQNCSNRTEDMTKDENIHLYISNIEPSIVEAWKSCVQKENNGFYCVVTPKDEGVLLAEIGYKKPDFGADKLCLDWKLHGFENTTDLPKVLVEGRTEIFLTKQKPDNEPAYFVANASAGNTKISCSHFMKISEDRICDNGRAFNAKAGEYYPESSQLHNLCKMCGVKFYNSKRGAECGAETFNSGTGVECGAATFKIGRADFCGIESYKTGRGPSCGVELFKEGVAAACGAASYVSGTGPICGIAEYNQKTDATVCGTTLTGLGPKPRTCSDPEFGVKTYHTCRHSSFGVESYKSCRTSANGVELYKECASKAFGVKSYNACRHEDFGAETYNTCRHEKFGVEQYKECRDPNFGVQEYNECFKK